MTRLSFVMRAGILALAALAFCLPALLSAQDELVIVKEGRLDSCSITDPDVRSFATARMCSR